MSTVAKIKSPKGNLEWVTIDGDGKENLSGKLQYVANVVIEANDPIVAAIEKFWEDNKPAGFKKDAKSNGLYPHKVATDESDENGKVIYKEDGKLYLAFKTGTSFPDGKPKVVQVYNAKARKVSLPDGTKIGNGSVGVISGAMAIYTNTTPKGALVDAGVTLYLDAIQILKLEEFTTDAGFTADEPEDGEAWTGDEDWTGDERQVPEAEEKPKSKPRL